MGHRPPTLTPLYSSAASDVYKRQEELQANACLIDALLQAFASIPKQGKIVHVPKSSSVWQADLEADG